jgi:hypothetical protein
MISSVTIYYNRSLNAHLLVYCTVNISYPFVINMPNMGIKLPTVSRMGKNITTASVDTLARYAKACGVNNATLYF